MVWPDVIYLDEVIACLQENYTIDTISACPSANMFSAMLGVFIRFVVHNGVVDNDDFSFLVTHVNAPRGTYKH